MGGVGAGMKQMEKSLQPCIKTGQAAEEEDVTLLSFGHKYGELYVTYLSIA